MKHTIPKLPYKYNALEPHIDAKTMEIHYTKHHQAYVDKLNIAVQEHPELSNKSVEELLKNLATLPSDIQTAIRNNGGGHYNHSMWWPSLKKGINPEGSILKAINKKWQSFDVFKEKFSGSAMTIFGSGWTWLVVNDKGELEIVNTPNQDNPISQGKVPLLGLDVWEHAYYLHYQNRRVDYISAWWNCVNWHFVEDNYEKAMKK
ncbi:MAG: superoxide dismutase [Candidatus Woesearchaeota archaeon]